MKNLVGIFFVVLAGRAQQKPCGAPPQWEAKVVEYNPTKNFTIYAVLTYDSEGERTRVSEVISYTGEVEKYYFEWIYLHKEHVMYQIQTILHPKLTRNCTATKLTQPFRKMIIPPDAIHSFAGYLGAAAGGGKGVLIDVFVGEIKEQKIRYSATVTRDGCTPVGETTDEPGLGFTMASFFDLVLGIPDPAVFDPPPECHKGLVRVDGPIEYHRIPKTINRF